MKKILDYSAKLLEIVTISLLVSMLFIISYQVFCRFVLNSPKSWSEELSILLLIWFGNLGIIIAVKEKTHMSIDYLYLKFSEKWKKNVDILYYILLMIFSVMMITQGFEILKIAKFQKLPATGISRIYFYLVLIVNGALTFLYTIQNLIERVYENKK